MITFQGMPPSGRIFGCLLCLCLCLCGAARAETYTMAQAVRQALTANPGLQAKEHLLEQARLNIGVARSAFLPRLSLVSSYERLKNSGDVGMSDELSSRSRSHGLRASLSLFAGFSHLNNLLKAKLSADMEEARHLQAQLELIVYVQLQFLQLLKGREDLKTAEESVRRLREQLKAAQAFVDVGMAPYLNVLQNETELARAGQRVIRARNEIRNAEAQLNRYLALPPGTPVVYSGRLRDFSGQGQHNYNEEEAIKTALYRRPDLIMAQKTVAIAFKDVDIRGGDYLPRVDATYDVMRFHRDYEDKLYRDYSRSYWAVGLSVSWEFFSGGGTTYGLLGDRQKARALQKDYEDAVSNARTEVIRALLDIGAARELIAASRKGVTAARESYAMADKRYQTHSGSMTELLDSQQRLTEAENEVSQAIAEYHSARARFFYYIGRKNPNLE